MDLANIEMAIFDVCGFSLGTEVSQIISIVRPCEDKMEQMDLGSPNARENLESVPLVDLSMQLEAREDWKAGKPEGRSSGCPAFWLSGCADNDGTVILLVDTAAGARGVHVDSVRDVVKMPLEQIEPLPEFLKSRIQTDCIWGIGKLEDELIILLDLDRYVLDAGCGTPEFSI
jgi:chemotaxis signal transduction protein